MSKTNDILEYAIYDLKRIQELAEDYDGDESSLDEIYTLARHIAYKLDDLKKMVD